MPEPNKAPDPMARPVVDLISSMRRSGEILHSPASLAPDGKLTPAGEVALGQLVDAIEELLQPAVEAKDLADLQALAIYGQARVTFGMNALKEGDIALVEDHLDAMHILLGNMAGCLAQLTGVSPDHVGNQTLN